MIKILLSVSLLLLSLSADEKVVLQLKWLHQFQFAGYYAAHEKGFYKEVGLDVEIRERDLDKNNVQQVIDDEAQYGVADSVLLLYKAKKEPVVIVAPIFQHSPNVLITLKSSGLDSPYKLESKNVTFYKNQIDGFSILAMLKNIDIHPNIYKNKEDTDYTYLINKKTDAFVGYLSNEAFYLQQSGVEINIIDPANYGFDFYGDMLFTSTKEAQLYPKRVEKFKKASLKGWAYALEHKEEIVQLIKKRYAPKKSLKHLRYEADAIEQVMRSKTIPIGTTDEGRIRYTLEVFEKHGLIKNRVFIDEYVFKMPESKKEGREFLTEQEWAYLKSKKVIKMCVDPDWMPLERIEKGVHVGMSAEYMKLFSAYIQTPIELVNTKTWTESIEYAKERKCDIFSLAMSTPDRESYMDFTEPYLSLPVVGVTNLDTLFIEDLTKIEDKPMGMVRDYALADILREKYPKMQIVDVENVKEGLEKVKNGELFCFIDTLSSAGYNIQKDYIGQLKIAGKFDEKWRLGVGTRNDEPYLREIFNKAIHLIPLEKNQEILNKWISVNYDQGEDYYTLFKWIGVISFIFLVILTAIMFANRRLISEITRRKEVEKRLELMSVTDALTSLYNRRHFNEMFVQMINSAKRENQNICFAILDVDFFKQYNDTYGHHAGDAVLKRFAKVMRASTLRPDDYCFRLGGEEFGILFKGTQTAEQAKRFVERIRANLENEHIEHKNSSASNYVTASFGLVIKEANSVEESDKLYQEADELLYQAKESGRNRVISNVQDLQ
ncbi:MAG: diguanylate cyclase [Epsilonproteobacteria bacterium]|nr:diguanylate cyclase [Campylobacterota bacterium]OIO14044.1 MAG: diguanylate cyclase [Helicobacteraceae bacterium CG1_02_36_14]PIP11466.1 MAG: diguanylate cyclase [Sulfurimonas sp. CG23_combo_of_CG06-09_8_20_14_all_36_33]PIS25179.1 MAG: diguanylate cyclase [Sulfurimonas sp. CG08_land_8_20_14_0_20_36_33]PIU36196.1 MAG: diguanylate cyclase [Sulfurimonas sp. CG07_land_8_20_14_0_80_36_56]PIV04727.1 MAG: diguanylate cyclase [Sulfurimonas sp. CG03_land_8_20_14_0_80_36_25]PIV35636.1 MAG: diguanyla